MSSLNRMLAILGLFTEERPSMTAEAIVEHLGCSQPTGYRYVRELVGAGLLARAAGRYSLGPRIIELDWQIRRCDPMLQESRDLVQALAAKTGCSVTLMGIYGDRIVTIHHERVAEGLSINFDRGRPMPLFRGAPSKAMLAFFPKARLERLWERHRGDLPPELRRRGKAAVFAELQEIRSRGWSLSVAELDADKVGIAAPVLRDGREVAGSVCLVMTSVRYETSREELLVEWVRDVATRLGERLGSPALPGAKRRRAA